MKMEQKMKSPKSTKKVWSISIPEDLLLKFKIARLERGIPTDGKALEQAMEMWLATNN